jgi:adenylate kinase
MDKGEYVPDEVTNLMVRARIDEAGRRPWLPARRLSAHAGQVEELDGMIRFTGHELDAAVVLTVDANEIVARLIQRAGSRAARTTRRVIRRRQEVYGEQTEPLIGVYQRRHRLRDRRDGRPSMSHPADLRRLDVVPPELTGR